MNNLTFKSTLGKTIVVTADRPFTPVDAANATVAMNETLLTILNKSLCDCEGCAALKRFCDDVYVAADKVGSAINPASAFRNMQAH